MAILHQAELRPSKLELLEEWVPRQSWFSGEGPLENIGSFRFDDPEGEVGVETILVRAGDGPVLQVPLTYRGAPLDGAEAWLIGTMEHSVLGSRWVYDGVGDPVYLQTVAAAALAGGHEAELIVEVDGETIRREPTARVSGSGGGSGEVSLPTVADIRIRQEGARTITDTAGLEVVVLRAPAKALADALDESAGTATLAGTWAGQSAECPLVFVSVR